MSDADRPDAAASFPIRIVLVDDHRLFREGLAGLIKQETGFLLVGEAGDATEAVRLAETTAPDVIILDVTIPDKAIGSAGGSSGGASAANGIATAKALRRLVPTAGIIALSMHNDSRFVTEMFQAGARGYVVKMCEFDELAEAIRTVNAGGHYVSGAVAGDVVHAVLAGPGVPAGGGSLSDREREILRLLADGKTAKESAAHLHVSVKTVDGHRRQIMQKLGLNSVAELTKYAIREGLTNL